MEETQVCIHRWIDKEDMVYDIYICMYVYNEILLSRKKKREILSLATILLTILPQYCYSNFIYIVTIMLSEINQSSINGI